MFSIVSSYCYLWISHRPHGRSVPGKQTQKTEILKFNIRFESSTKKAMIKMDRQIANGVSLAERKLWRNRERQRVSWLWRPLKIRKSNLNLNCYEIGSQRMDSRNANDNTEEEVNEISTESLWLIKKKNNNERMERTKEVLVLCCFWLTGKDGAIPITVRKKKGSWKGKGEN